MTPELQRLNEKRERLMAKRALLPEGERTAIDAEVKATAEMIVRRVAVAPRLRVGGALSFYAKPEPLSQILVDGRHESLLLSDCGRWQP